MTVRPRTSANPAPATPVVPSRGALRPLGQGEVRITGGFWAERQAVNAGATLEHIGKWLEHEGWAANFDLAAAGRLPAGRRGRVFSDSEVYKYLEALAWEIGRCGDEPMEERLRALVARIGAAQESDGYLNTAFGRPGQPARWSDLEWGHELYCLGHLCQAAVARERTRPGADDGLLAIARRAADQVCAVFGPDGIPAICGHPGIEPALVELARVTGEPRYLAQAELFVRRRGHATLGEIEWGRSYFQDDVPVRAADRLRGHVVRAGYLAAGAVDVAVETEDAELLAALDTQWRNTIARRTYVTGGQGSHHQDEAFGEDWELPPDRAYSETCAAVGSIMFSWRLLLGRGEARHADLIERTLYNVVATSPSADGTAFFYTNTLHRRQSGGPPAGAEVSIRPSAFPRAAWFEVSCCPPNVARTLASLDGYLATADDDGVQLHQYAAGTIRTRLPDGRPIRLEIDTDYPRDGLVRIRVTGEAAGPWTLTLRVPAWARGAVLACSPMHGPGSEQDAPPGWVSLRRDFRAGDVVELRLPLQPRISTADPRIDAVRGCAVVERGPLVLCLESVDLAAATGGELADVAQVRLDPAVAPRLEAGEVIAAFRRAVDPAVDKAVDKAVDPAVASAGQDWPYRPDANDPVGTERIEVRLCPYHEWGERGPASMRVWLPVVLPVVLPVAPAALPVAPDAALPVTSNAGGGPADAPPVPGPA